MRGTPDKLMIDALPRTRTLLGDRGYDANWFRHALAERSIAACIPSKVNRKLPIPHNAKALPQTPRDRNMFGKLKQQRRIHTRYDHCATPSCPQPVAPQPASPGSINEH